MMIKKILQHFWRARFEFSKYFVIGISGVLIDISTLIFFKEVFGLVPVFAVIVNQLLILIYIFYLNKYWTFRNREMVRGQVVKFLVLASFNYLFSVLVMYGFNYILEFDYRLVRLSNIVLAVSWNFLLYKHWVFK